MFKKFFNETYESYIKVLFFILEHRVFIKYLTKNDLKKIKKQIIKIERLKRKEIIKENKK